MNTKILPLVAIMSGLLVGCSNDDSGSSGGSDGGGTTPSTKINLQFVKLETDLESDIPSNCAIYGEVAQDPAVVAGLSTMSSSVEKLLAYAVPADYGFDILIHDENGEIVSNETNSLGSNGQIAINLDDIPTGGYLSVEEYSGIDVNAIESHILAIEKSFVSDMSIYVRTRQRNSDCITGEGFSEYSLNENAETSVSSYGVPEGAVISNLDKMNRVESYSGFLPVDSDVPAANRLLVTTYANFDSVTGSVSDLLGYGLVQKGNIYSTEDIPDAPATTPITTSVDTISLDIDTDVDLSDSSSLDVYLDGGLYIWQPLNTATTEFGFPTSETELSLWSLFLEGDHNSLDWTYKGIHAFDGQPSVEIETLTVDDLSATSLSIIGTSLNIDTTGIFSENQVEIQRTNLRTVTNSTTPKPFTQTIYAPGNNEQPIMESLLASIKSTGAERYEIAILNGENTTTEAKYLMELHSDLDNASSTYNYLIDEYVDAVGVISFPSEKAQLRTDVASSSFDILTSRTGF